MRVWIGLALAVAACTSPPNFVCASNTQCISEDGAPGICETNGSCTFADSTCPGPPTGTGRRYPDGATGALASTCLAPTKSCVTQIAAGTSHTCALRSDGTVWCWGANETTEVSPAAGDQLVPVQVHLPTGRTATAVSAGEDFSCALMDDKTVWCWGGNGSKQLGQCTASPPDSSATPLEVIAYTANVNNPSSPTCNVNNAFHATQLTSGGEHSCAIGADGKLYCWGENQTGSHGGQSGQDPAVFDDVPGPLAMAFDGAVAVQAGDEYSCLLKDEHSVWCFGANSLGELGSGNTTDSFTPLNVSGLSDAKALVLDDETACVQTNDGAIWCWGSAASGIFGADLSTNVLAARRITSTVEAFSGGTSETLCFSDQGATLQCFGANNTDQAALEGEANITTPTQVPLITVAQLSMGGDHACAATTDGALWCWGDNSHGQFGNNTMSDTPSANPVRVTWTCP